LTSADNKQAKAKGTNGRISPPPWGWLRDFLHCLDIIYSMVTRQWHWDGTPLVRGDRKRRRKCRSADAIAARFPSKNTQFTRFNAVHDINGAPQCHLKKQKLSIDVVYGGYT
jgi:hypothetical protein